MTRLIAEVLLGLFRSWEFLFITFAIIVLLPFVFSLASRERGGKKRGKNRAAVVEAAREEKKGEEDATPED
jgi:hypothetical protein